MHQSSQPLPLPMSGSREKAFRKLAFLLFSLFRNKHNLIPRKPDISSRYDDLFPGTLGVAKKMKISDEMIV